MDGLLIDSEQFWRDAITGVLKTVGVDISNKIVHETKGMRTSEVVSYWYHKYPWVGPSQTEVEELIVKDVIDSVHKGGKLLPGALHTLEVCHEAHIPLVLASSSSMEIIEAVLDTLKIRHFFTYVCSGKDELLSKPHPGIFITAAHKLNVSPHDIVVFEDAPSGILAAKAAKMFCIAVPEPATKSHPFIQIADITLDSLEEFELKMLEKLGRD